MLYNVIPLNTTQAPKLNTTLAVTTSIYSSQAQFISKNVQYINGKTAVDENLMLKNPILHSSPFAS